MRALYCDARKSHLASIKCKKPLARAYSAPLDPLADREGAGCPHPTNPIPALGLSGLACPRPLIFKSPPN